MRINSQLNVCNRREFILVFACKQKIFAACMHMCKAYYIVRLIVRVVVVASSPSFAQRKCRKMRIGAAFALARFSSQLKITVYILRAHFYRVQRTHTHKVLIRDFIVHKKAKKQVFSRKTHSPDAKHFCNDFIYILSRLCVLGVCAACGVIAVNERRAGG